MPHVYDTPHRVLSIITLVLTAASAAFSAGWELRRNDLAPDRPAVVNGTVSVDANDIDTPFPRYLKELGIDAVKISFREPGGVRKRLSVVWSGGSQGLDRFSVSVDGIPHGVSRLVDSTRRPYAWYRDDFDLKLALGRDHTIELRPAEGCDSPVEFAGIRLSDTGVGSYQPLCYESIGSLERYEAALDGKGVAVESPHLVVFAPKESSDQAKALSVFLEKACSEMKSIFGADTVFRFSVEHYPPGHKRAWGGISGAGTIGYSTEALERFSRLGTSDVRGFAGYTEEMCHGFKALYKCTGTYEALGVAVQEDVVRRLVPASVADAFWLPEHKQWDETHKAYLTAGRVNPDTAKYPNNVLYTRILNDVFLKLRTEYGPAMWPDFFTMLRQMDYPLHRSGSKDTMKTYADIFSALFGRPMRTEFEAHGIDLNADPPWGWQTYN